MSRSILLLIIGIHGSLLAVGMIFATELSLKLYGVPQVDVSHISTMQYLGVSTGCFALLALLNRNAPNSVSLRTLLQVMALLLLAGIVLGVYQAYLLHTPFSGFFVGDSLFRLAMGVGLLYCYNREIKLVLP
jgi:hypothetical protein